MGIFIGDFRRVIGIEFVEMVGCCGFTGCEV